MAWTQDDLTKLDKAIAKGARKIKFKDDEIEFQDLESMLKLRKAMRKELGLDKRDRRATPSFDKGLG